MSRVYIYQGEGEEKEVIAICVGGGGKREQLALGDTPNIAARERMVTVADGVGQSLPGFFLHSHVFFVLWYKRLFS